MLPPCLTSVLSKEMDSDKGFDIVIYFGDYIYFVILQDGSPRNKWRILKVIHVYKEENGTFKVPNFILEAQIQIC